MNELISATRAAYYAFNMVRQGQVKALAASFIPVWETNQPQEPAVDFETLAIVGYARNPIVFACIEALAQSSSEAPAKVMQRQDSGVWEEDFTHPLRQLLQFPNQFESGFELVETIITHLYISGNAYLEKERVGGQVVGLHPLMPHKMRVVPGRSFIQGYEYMVGDRNIPLKREDVIHFKLPNPINRYYGLSPLAVLARVVDADNSTIDWIRVFFQNSAVPMGILKTKHRIDEIESQRIKERWQEKFQGSNNWHDIAVLDTDADYMKIGVDIDEMNVTALTGMTESRICCLPDTEILTQRGVIKITDVEVGDMVVTHKGRWRKVNNVIVNPAHDQVVEVYARGLSPLCVTGNHPIFAAKYTQTLSHKQIYHNTEWVAARDLQPKKTRGGWDALTIPLLRHENGNTLRLSDWINGRRFSTKEEDSKLVHTHPMVTPLPAEIEYTSALGRLVGFYLAEGSQGGGKLHFYFHENEVAYQQIVSEDLRTVFGVDSQLVHKEEHSVIVVQCQNAMLTELFACGTARTKQVPEWAWNGNDEFMEAMLWAWVAGDGNVNNRITRVTTSSYDLAWQMRLVAISCGREASIITCDREEGMIDDRVLPARTVYVVSWIDEKKRRGIYRIDGSCLTSAIQYIEPIDYKGLVYNLEIEEDESYLTLGGMVHNCAVFKVHPVIAGVEVGLDSATHSNLRSVKRAFWDGTLVPLYKRLEMRLNLDLANDFNLDATNMIRYDFSQVRALQEDEEELWLRASRGLRAGGTTINDFRRMVNLPTITGGDVLLIPSNTVPMTLDGEFLVTDSDIDEPGTEGQMEDEVDESLDSETEQNMINDLLRDVQENFELDDALTNRIGNFLDVQSLNGHPSEVNHE